MTTNRTYNRTVLLSYTLGFALSIALTVFAFTAATHTSTFTIPLIIIAALFQLAVQFIFFLHLTSGPESKSQAPIFAFTFIIIGIVVGGTLWIMSNLERLHLQQPTLNDIYENGQMTPEYELH